MRKTEIIDEDLMNSGTCLYQSSPIPLNPELAFLLGDSDLAVVLQQIHYWLQNNKQQMTRGKCMVNVIRENRVWCFHTYEEWEEQFIWMDLRTIKRKITKLEELGLIISGDFNAMRKDRTKWYTIDYKKVAELTEEFNAKMAVKMDAINKRKAKQKEYNQAQNSGKKAKCQNVTMASGQDDTMPKCQNVTMPLGQADTMPKCQSVTSNNKRLTVKEIPLQETNPQENNFQETNLENSKPVVDSSVSQSAIRQRQTDELNTVNLLLYNEIDINNLKEWYKDPIIGDIELNIIEMFLQDETIVNKVPQPKQLIQAMLMRLTSAHIEYIVNKFHEISKNKKIENNKGYLQSMIYNSVFEANASVINDIKSKGLC